MTISPLFIASYGRSGSTLLMRALQAHPNIILRNIFPYETRFAQYAFIGSAQGIAKPYPQALVDYSIPYEPFHAEDAASHQWLSAHKNINLGGHGLLIAQEYYNAVAQWQNTYDIAWFAEKCIGLHLLERLLPAWPTIVIGLLRDPRDTFISVKFFNRKRGFLSFGEQDGEEELFRQILIFHKAWLKLAATFPDRTLTLKYEELVNTSMSAFLELTRMLKIENNDKTLEAMHMAATRKDDAVLRHRSSAGSVGDTNGRWRMDAAPEHHSLFRQYHEKLEELGYE